MLCVSPFLIYHKMKALFIVMTMLLLCSTALVIYSAVEQDIIALCWALYLCGTSAIGAAIAAGKLDDRRLNK